MLEEKIIKHLDIIPLEDIKPHEQTIATNYKNLLEKTRRTGLFIDPLVVDKKTGFLLDGHHRFKVMKEMGCRGAIVQKVNYMKDYIKLGTWFPFVRETRKIFNKFEFEEVDFDLAKQELEKMKIPFIYRIYTKTQKKTYIFKDIETRGFYGMFKNQSKLTHQLEKQGIHLEYCADDLFENYLKKRHGVLIRRIPKKEELIELATKGKVLPPKSTRHEIQNRLIRINMPFGWLVSLPPDEARKRIIQKLKRKITHRLVRTYNEPVIVFY